MTNKENVSIENIISKESEPVKLMTTKADKLFKLTTDKDVEKATELAIQIKNKFDELEDERKSYTKPINDSIHRLNARFKELTEPLKKAENAIKEAILSYRSEKETQRLKDQAKLQKKSGDENVIVQSTLRDVVESKSGESRVTKKWTYSIVDITKVPREFLMVDDDKVSEAIKDGKRKIAGLNIFEKENLSLFR